MLNVIPLAQLAVERERSVVLYAPFGIARIGFLRGDEDHTVARTATIQRRSSRTLQHRHRLDVIRVDGRDSVTQVITALGTCLAVTGVVHRHTVNDIQRLVVTRDLGVTTQHDARRTCSTTGRLLYYQSGHTTGHRRGSIRVAGFGQVITLDLAYLITQGFAVTLDTHSRYYHLGEHFRILLHQHADHVRRDGDSLRSITHVGEHQLFALGSLDCKLTIHVGHRTTGGSFDQHSSPHQRAVSILDESRHGALCKRHARKPREERYEQEHRSENVFHTIINWILW